MNGKCLSKIHQLLQMKLLTHKSLCDKWGMDVMKKQWIMVREQRDHGSFKRGKSNKENGEKCESKVTIRWTKDQDEDYGRAIAIKLEEDLVTDKLYITKN